MSRLIVLLLCLPLLSCGPEMPIPSDGNSVYRGDADGDGYTNDVDCNDLQETVHPGATEICDGLDSNCDGEVPDDELDADGDGYMGCEADCDDADPDSYPYAVELCDGLDNDCDGEPADDEVDLDGDGSRACEDCDDADADSYPGA